MCHTYYRIKIQFMDKTFEHNDIADTVNSN